MKLQTEPINKHHRFWADINALAKEAFPPEEYLAPETLVDMAKSDQFDFWALTENDTFAGFLVVLTYEDMAYLFFLAIDGKMRGKGYGSRAIETLCSLYPDKQQVVDFEMLDEGAENNPQRIRRKAFYQRNGYRETGLFLSYLGVDYEVMCMGESFSEEAFRELMKTIQVEGFAPRYFHREG